MGELAWCIAERYLKGVCRLFTQGVKTNLGILHEAGHQELWIIGMDCAPTRTAVHGHAAHWAIDPMFSDFKGRCSTWRIRNWSKPTACSGCSSSCRWRCTVVSPSAGTTP